MTSVLDRAARRLTARVEELEARLQAHDETAWPAYLEAVKALAAVAGQAAPERRGALLTTQQMAERLGVTPKTLLRHRATGAIRPALAKGKMLRWSGSERLA